MFPEIMFKETSIIVLNGKLKKIPLKSNWLYTEHRVYCRAI